MGTSWASLRQECCRRSSGIPPGPDVELLGALQEHAVATAGYLEAPDPAAGMALYSLACARAQAGLTGEAGHDLAEAIRLNPDVRANAQRDPDLAPLRGTGQLGLTRPSEMSPDYLMRIAGVRAPGMPV